MAQARKPLQKKASESASDRTARNETVARIEWQLETIPKKPTAS